MTTVFYDSFEEADKVCGERQEADHESNYEIGEIFDASSCYTGKYIIMKDGDPLVSCVPGGIPTRPLDIGEGNVIVVSW